MKHAGKSKETYVQTFWLLLAFERSVFDDNIWQQLDYSLQLNNSRKGAWSAAFTITVIIEFLRTHEGRVDCKKAVPMALFKHDCSPHLHCIHPPAQGWHWASFKWSRNKLKSLFKFLIIFIMTSEASGAADTSLGNSSSMCDGVKSRLGYFFGESGCVFSKDLWNMERIGFCSGSCGYLSPRKSSCQWSWPKTIISMPIDLNLKNKTIPKTMETHAENMACSMQKSKKN